MKIWKNGQKGDDRIIAYMNRTIYKANPPVAAIDKYITELETGTVSTAFLGIPLHYIRQVRLQEGKKYIEVFFGKGSCEHLCVTDDVKRNELFDYLKQHLPGSYATGKYTALQAGQKPLIAMAVVVVFFALCLHYAINIEQGTEYTVKGLGITSMALAIGSLGIAKVVLIFSSLFIIAAASFARKIKKRPVIRQILVNR